MPNGRTRMTMRAVAASLLLLLPAVAHPQGRGATLVGVVRDSAGRPVNGVEVRLKGVESLAITSEIGGFRLQNLPMGPASVMVRRLGFAPVAVDVVLRPGRIDSLVLSLTAAALTLPGMTVEEEGDARSRRFLAGFWDRRNRGFGHYITRAEIVARDPHDFTDIVRMTPGLRVTYRNGRQDVRFNRGGSVRGDCPPQYFVDGQRIENGRAEEFSAQDIEAVELYNGASTMPAQFTPRMDAITCGAIVIWTRLPGT